MRRSDDVWESRVARSEEWRAGTWQWARRAFICITLIGGVALGSLALWAVAHVVRAVLLVVIAALLAYALAPIVSWLRRWLPRWLALLVAYIGLLVVVGLFGYLVVTAAIAQLTTVVAQARVFLTPGQHGTAAPFILLLERLGLSRTQIDAGIQRVAVQLETIGHDVVPVLTGLVNGTLDTVLILVLSVYLFIDGARVGRWLRTGTPRRYRPRITSFLNTFQRVVGGYIRGQLLLSALIGVLVGGGMAVLQVPYALLLGLMAFVLEFIPILGTLASGAVCVLIALTHGWLLALIVLAYFIVVHVIEGDIVGPRIVGRAVGLHPVVSIVALIAGAELFGLWGALFAAPVAGVVQAVIVDFWYEWRRAHGSEFADDTPRADIDNASVAGVPTAAHP
ncbi:MAG: AI-2E family transporter [Ktedonobacterales bacterium]